MSFKAWMWSRENHGPSLSHKLHPLERCASADRRLRNNDTSGLMRKFALIPWQLKRSMHDSKCRLESNPEALNVVASVSLHQLLSCLFLPLIRKSNYSLKSRRDNSDMKIVSIKTF